MPDPAGVRREYEVCGDRLGQRGSGGVSGAIFLLMAVSASTILAL